MEASGAGLAGQGQAQGDGEGGGEAQQGPDVASLSEQLGGLNQSQEQMRQTLQQMQEFMAGQQSQEPGQEEQQEPDGLDLSFLDDPQLTPEQIAQQLGGLIDQSAEQRAQQLLQQHISPLSQQVADMRLESQAERLVQEFPEMAEQETAERVVGTARQYAELMGRPELANDPAFWRLTYLAGRAADQANAEEGEDPQAAHLEGAGGAGPGGQQQPTMEQIFADGSEGLGRRALPFG